jgi:hypothetical protein
MTGSRRVVPWTGLALVAAIIIHLLFYVSARSTGWFDPFFEHVTPGQDFFQIPNGAAAYLSGGTLTGHPPARVSRYTNCCGVNDNVYHPLLTILIGIPLQLVPPQAAFDIWLGVHLLVTVLVLVYAWRNFRTHPLIVPAVCLYLINSYHYYEIQHAQFHFLLTASFLLLFLHLVRRGDSVVAGILLWVSLIVKPVGLLFVIPLLLAGYWMTAVVGVGLFAAATVPLLWWAPGKYYLDNMVSAMKSVYPSYNLMAVVRVFPAVPIAAVTVLRNLTAAGLLLYQLVRKPPLIIMLILWTVFQLVFYSGVYHYYYAVTAVLILVAMVTGSIRRSWKSLLAVTLLTIPTPIIFLHRAGDPAILPQEHLSAIALYSVATVVLFAAAVMASRPSATRRER